MLDLETKVTSALEDACQEAVNKANASGLPADQLQGVENKCKTDGLSTISDQKQATQTSLYTQCLSAVEAEAKALGNATVDSWDFAKASATNFLSNHTSDFDDAEGKLSAIVKSRAASAESEASGLWSSLTSYLKGKASTAEAGASNLLSKAKTDASAAAAGASSALSSAKNRASSALGNASSLIGAAKADAASALAKAETGAAAAADAAKTGLSAAATKAKAEAAADLSAAKTAAVSAADSAATAAKNKASAAAGAAENAAAAAKTKADTYAKDALSASQRLFLDKSTGLTQADNNGTFSGFALLGLGLLSVAAFAAMAMRHHRRSYRSALAIDSDASDGGLLE